MFRQNQSKKKTNDYSNSFYIYDLPDSTYIDDTCCVVECSQTRFGLMTFVVSFELINRKIPIKYVINPVYPFEFIELRHFTQKIACSDKCIEKKTTIKEE